MDREGRSRRRHAILGLVIIVHALLMVLALRHQQAIKIARESTTSPLIFLTPPAPVPPPSTALPAKSNDTASTKTSSKRAEPATGDFAITLDTPATRLSGDLPLRLGVDWDVEESAVANSQAAAIFKELRHLCDEAQKRRDPPPPGCHRYRPPPPWDPEPSKFGLTDGPGLRLPFMRLGRCVIGLGFFGCGIGKLPEANGHVFDDFRDPDRPRSSVPDPNDRPD